MRIHVKNLKTLRNGILLIVWIPKLLAQTRGGNSARKILPMPSTAANMPAFGANLDAEYFWMT